MKENQLRKEKRLSRKWGIVISIIVFVLVILTLYQWFLVTSTNKAISGKSIINYKGTIHLTEGEICNNSFNNLTFCVPDGFSRKESSDDSLVMYADSSDRYLMIGKFQNSLEQEILDLNEDINVKKFMEKYQFQDIVDVLHYYEKHEQKEISFLSFPSTIKEYYVIWSLVNIYLPEGDLYYIDGDYYGYLVKQKNNYAIYLYDKNDALYNISLQDNKTSDGYFSIDNVKKILSTIHFQD